MNPYMLYFVKSFLGMGIFYITWLLFFRKQTDFRFNRYYLVFTTLLSVTIPLIHLPELFPAGFQNPIAQLSAIQMSEVLIGNTGGRVANGAGLSLETVLTDIYLLGILIMTIRFVWSLLQLNRLVRQSETLVQPGIKFVFTTEKLPVFSFFRYVFISRTLFENPRAAVIVQHEKVHVKEKHSLDLILFEILSVFQWFNPVVYLIKKAVKENHEFIADSNMSVSESSGNSYLNLLFSEAGGFEFSPITHNFSYSLLKKRMIMMKNQKSPKSMPVKLLLSVLALTLTLFACNNQTQPAPKKLPKVINVTKNEEVSPQAEQNLSQKKVISSRIDTGKVFVVLKKMPEYPGGTKALLHYLATNIKYPAEAKKAKIQGRVFLNFIVEKDGSISHVKVLRGIGHGCDAEAVKVIENMPRWIPGHHGGKPVRFSYNIPIKFSLN